MQILNAAITYGLETEWIKWKRLVVEAELEREQKIPQRFTFYVSWVVIIDDYHTDGDDQVAEQMIHLSMFCQFCELIHSNRIYGHSNTHSF